MWNNTNPIDRMKLIRHRVLLADRGGEQIKQKELASLPGVTAVPLTGGRDWTTGAIGVNGSRTAVSINDSVHCLVKVRQSA